MWQSGNIGGHRIAINQECTRSNLFSLMKVRYGDNGERTRTTCLVYSIKGSCSATIITHRNGSDMAKVCLISMSFIISARHIVSGGIFCNSRPAGRWFMSTHYPGQVTPVPARSGQDIDAAHIADSKYPTITPPTITTLPPTHPPTPAPFIM